MFIPRVYFPQALKTDEVISFDKEASHYLSTVLRLHNEEPIVLFNGEGGEFTAVVQMDPKRATALVQSFNPINRTSGLSVHLGQGIARGERMDYVIQKATELGVTEITPLFSEKTQVKLDEERKGKRALHWERIAISACEQSGLNIIPKIHPAQSLESWSKQPFSGTSIVFEPHSHDSLKALGANNSIRIAIGPESGWSQAEVNALTDQGFLPLHLGPRVLRTETAGMVAISILQGLYGDLK